MKRRHANRLLLALEGLERDPLPPGGEVRALWKRSSYRHPIYLYLEALLLAGWMTQKDHRRVLSGVSVLGGFVYAAVMFVLCLFLEWTQGSRPVVELFKRIALGAALAFWGGVAMGLLMYALGRWQAARCAKLLKSLDDDKPIEPIPRLPSGLPPR